MTKDEQLNIIAEKICSCTKCPTLLQRTKTVPGEGNSNSRLVICAEAPGRDEDLQGRPLIGRSGKLLNEILTQFGIPREKVYILNTLKCRPPNNRTPLPEELENCRGFLDLQLSVITPEFILCLGGTAAKHILRTEIGITRLRGKTHEIQNPVPAKVICTWHPSYVLRNPAAKQGMIEDMELLVSYLAKP